MLFGNQPGFTLLSNKDFWDPKNIQLFEDDVERSANKPNINVKYIVFENNTCDDLEVKKTWMKIREKRNKRNKDFFKNIERK